MIIEKIVLLLDSTEIFTVYEIKKGNNINCLPFF